MDYRNNKHTDPWDEGVFGTGNTMPPKNHSGLVALLLILVIFLSGIISVLSFLNIRLFQQLTLQQEKQEEISPVSFSDHSAMPLATQPQIPESLPQPHSAFSIQLNKAPQESVPQENPLSMQAIYEKNIPSVVSILSTTQTGNVSGSGMVISPDGYLVTTCRTITDAETITVTFSNGESCFAIVVGADALTDLAVLYVDKQDLSPVEFGDSAGLKVGDEVAAIGDPLGTQIIDTLTPGIISAIHRNILVNGQSIHLLQSSIPLNSGDSGGPLINCYGQVVGINTTNTALFSDRENLNGFALPSAMVKDIVEQLVAQGYVSGRPTLGLTGDPVSRFDQYYFHIPAGLYIDWVDPHCHAWDQGIQPGDILMSIDGIPITQQADLDSLVSRYPIGHQVTALFFRDGAEQVITLTLTEYVG